MKREETSGGAKFRLPKFESEILLQQAIAGLLSRMPGITGVQILQGAQEYGKDIIFYSSGPLGEQLPCACVIKNVKISGAVGQDRGARTVFEQVEQAIDTPFLDGSGEEVRVHRVYVISPAEITQIAINSVKGKLAGHSGQVMFVGGDQLFQFFRQYWPDFFADEFNAIEKYLNDISELNTRNALGGLIHLYGLGELDKTDTAIYVERHFYRHIPVYTLKPLRDLALWDVFDDDRDPEVDRDRIIRIRENIELLQKTLKYFDRWGYVNPIFHSNEHTLSVSFEHLDEACTALKNSLIESWMRNVRSKLKQQNISLEQVPSQQRVKIPDFKALKKTASLLTRSLEESLSPLREACRVTWAVSQMKSSDLSILSSPAWLASSRLDDCLDFAPQDVCDATTGLTVTFNETQLRECPGAVLILAAAGYGKTSLCRWNALVDAEQFRLKKGKTFPVYVPLHTLSTVKLETFEGAFLKSLGHSALLQGLPSQDSYNIRLYLDGLDEVPTEAQQRAIIELVKGGRAGAKNMQIVITARDHVVGGWLDWLPKLYLGGLNEAEVKKLKLGWFKGQSTLRKEFESQLTKSTGFSELMEVPLMASLIIHVYRQTRRLPENKIRLYNVFLDLLCEGWDLAKNVLRPSAFGRLMKIVILGEVAANTHFNGKRYFRAAEIFSVFQKVLSNRADSSFEIFEAELLRDGIISRSGEQYFFSHLSFQEFLTAKHIKGNPTSDDIKRVLKKLLNGEQWWREVFRFYIGLTENPSEVTRWLLGELDKRPDSDQRARGILLMVEETYPDFDLASFVRTYSKRKWI
jgi:hypothetical protein